VKPGKKDKISLGKLSFQLFVVVKKKIRGKKEGAQTTKGQSATS
jgi:hypothetical protein